MVDVWLITEKGFVSAVEYRTSKDRTAQLPAALQPPAEFTEQLAVGATRNMIRAYKARKRAHEAHMREYEELTQDGFILARARVHDDLEQLRPFFGGLEIKEDKGADYKFRAVMPRQAFTDWIADMAWDINYDSHFKEVAKERSPEDPERYSAMMACWTALNRMGHPKDWFKSTGKLGSAGGSGSGHWDAVQKKWIYSSGYTPTSSRSPFGTGKTTSVGSGAKTSAGDGLSDAETQKMLDEFEATHAATRAELATGMAEMRNDKGDTVAGMVKQFMDQDYEELDVDMHVPDGPYELYIVVGEWLMPLEKRPTTETLKAVLTELIESEKTMIEDRARYQEVLDLLDGVPEANKAGEEEAAPEVQDLTEADLKRGDKFKFDKTEPTGPAVHALSVCEVAGRHLLYRTGHTLEECWAEQAKEHQAEAEIGKPEDAEVSS